MKFWNLFKGSFSSHYAQYRPQYPSALFDYLWTHCKHRNVAIDIGCGTGQATRELAKKFQRVYGIDPSETQLQNAKGESNIVYSVGSADDLGFVDKKSVDLITVAQAFHWLDQEKFFDQCRMVLKDDGLVAIWMYNLNVFDDNLEANEVLNSFYKEKMGRYWAGPRKMIDENYSKVSWPKDAMVDHTVHEYVKEMPLVSYIRYLETWSAYQTFVKKHGPEKGQQELDSLQKQFQASFQLDSPENEIRVRWSNHLYLLSFPK